MYHYPVILNLRGERFQVNTRTLRKCPGANDLSIFLCMDLPRSGELFIDRDPEIFVQILFYLQDGRINVRFNENLLALVVEAKYYGLHHLAARLCNLQPFDGEITIVANRGLPAPSGMAIAEEGIPSPSGSCGTDEEFVFETRASYILGKRRWWKCHFDGPDWLDYFLP